MSPQYEYYALLSEMDPDLSDPGGVIRRWTDEDGQVHDERYSRRLTWETTRDLVMIENGEWRAEAHPITEEAVAAFQAATYEKVHAEDPEDGKYSYFAQVDTGHPVDAPIAVVRTWTTESGLRKEQTYVPGPGYGWEWSHLLTEMFYGRERGDLVPITEDAAMRLVEGRD